MYEKRMGANRLVSAWRLSVAASADAGRNNQLALNWKPKTEKYHLVLIFPALNLRDIFELLSYHL
jgi:hypothetical protein